MSVRWLFLIACSAVVVLSAGARAQSPTDHKPPTNDQRLTTTDYRARTVVFHPRDLIAVRARLHYTTLLVLPEGEEVVEATCGDKEVWIVTVRGGLVSIKPAKPGGETNLNVVG